MSCKERPGEYSRLPRETVVQPRVDKGLNYRRATEKGGDGVGIFETGSAERGDCWMWAVAPRSRVKDSRVTIVSWSLECGSSLGSLAGVEQRAGGVPP